VPEPCMKTIRIVVSHAARASAVLARSRDADSERAHALGNAFT
jgi:hypothetical protein